MPVRFAITLLATLFCASLRAQAPSAFVENRGQWPAPISFKAGLTNATLWCEQASLLLDLYRPPAERGHHADAKVHVPEKGDGITHHHALRLTFADARPDIRKEALGVQRGAYNFLLGNDPSHWAHAAHAFTAVLYHGVWPGIDVRVRAGESDVEYDLLLAAGADASAIGITYSGAAVELSGEHLVVRTSLGDLTESIPAAYQEQDGQRIPVPCRYALHDGTVRFTLGAHDPSLPVVIDPSLVFSSFSGSFSDNFGYTATYDNKGFLYSGSTAFGQGYPTTIGAYDTIHGGGDGLFDGIDIALTKYDTTGSFLVWSTFLGGSSDELPHSLVVNANDELFMLGTTGSPDFPTTANALDGSFNGGPAVDLSNGLGCNFPHGVDMVLARLSADGGDLLASTFIGGSGTDGLNRTPNLKFNYADEVRGEVELDQNDNVYVVSSTNSVNFPTTPDAYRTTYQGGDQDGVVLKMDASLTTLFWSTYFGGSGSDAIYSLDRDDLQNVYICGGTGSIGLPFPNGYATFFQGDNADGFVAELSYAGDALLAGSYYGSLAYDQAYFVEHDELGNRFLFGQTRAATGQLVFNAPYNIPHGGQFIAKLDAGLHDLLMASRFGSGDGTPDISPVAFLVDYCDKIYICGWGSSIQGGSLSTTGLPVTSDAYQGTTTGNDFYLAVFDINMTALYYGTYMGGNQSFEHVDGGTSRFDRRGRIYESVCAGCGGHSDFPTTADAWSNTNNSGLCNNAVFKFDFDFPIVVADFTTRTACMPAPIQFTNISSNAESFSWDFGDQTGSTETSPEHSYTTPGVYIVRLVANNPLTCNGNDTTLQQVVVLGNASYALRDTTTCAGNGVQIGLLPVASPDVTYHWSPTAGLSNPNVANPIATPQVSTTYTLLISNGLCTDTVTQRIDPNQPVMHAAPDTIICGPSGTVHLIADSDGNSSLFHWSTFSTFTDFLNSPATDSTVTVTVSGVDAWYHVRAEGNGCNAQDSVFIDLQAIAPAISGDALICADRNGILTLTGIDAGSTIVWSPADSLDAGQGTVQATFSPAASMSAHVHVVTPGGCVWDGQADVIVSPVNAGDVHATVDQPIVLAGTTVHLHGTPTSGVNYGWAPPLAVSDPAASDPTAFVSTSTTFVLTVTDGVCTHSDSVKVKVYEVNCGEPDIFVPDAFTPNGDGNNDVLRVRGRAITGLDFKVFDRWGEEVFATTDMKQGWDGTFQGKAVDPAVYVYWLKAQCVEGQSFFKKGNVTVIR